jgi:hypothetical protein
MNNNLLKKRGSKAIGVLIVVFMFMSIIPSSVYAEDILIIDVGMLPSSTFDLSTGKYDDNGEAGTSEDALDFNKCWLENDTYLHVTEGADITITGTSTSGSEGIRRVIVDGRARVTINNAKIESTTAGTCAFKVTSGSNLDLILKGENTLISGQNCAGINVEGNATLNINGDGSLYARAGSGGAGIGGNSDGYVGTININGGNIEAHGGWWGAGIGSGGAERLQADSPDNMVKNLGNIRISGGKVSAYGGSFSAGIGNGQYSSGGNILIEGGNILAKGLTEAAAIGCARFSGSTVDSIRITGGVLYLLSEGGQEIYTGDPLRPSEVSGCHITGYEAEQNSPKSGAMSLTKTGQNQRVMSFTSDKPGSIYYLISDASVVRTDDVVNYGEKADIVAGYNEISVNLPANQGGNLYYALEGTPIPYVSPRIMFTIPQSKIDTIIYGGSADVPYDGSVIDLSKLDSLFELPNGSGPRTYTIECEDDDFYTGEGTLDGSLLTVTKAGNFAIGLSTDETDAYTEGREVGNLVVSKGVRAVSTGVKAVGVSKSGLSDGKIQGLIPNTLYEYKVLTNGSGDVYTDVWSDSKGEITGVSEKTIVLRLPETDLYNVSPDSKPLIIGVAVQPVTPRPPSRPYSTTPTKPSTTTPATKKISLKKASIKSIKIGKKRVTVKWKKSKESVTGHQIAYKQKGKKKFKTIKVKGKKKVSRVIKKLKAGKRYQFKIRTYKKVGKKTYYSKYSKIKTSKKVKR